jgi:hypothetical protein
MKFRVRKSDGVTHAFWANEDEATRLIRAGLARSYGTGRRIRGLVLKCDVDQAGTLLYGALKSGGSRRGFFREHIADRFYIFQHSAPLSAAQLHLALAA